MPLKLKSAQKASPLCALPFFIVALTCVAIPYRSAGPVSNAGIVAQMLPLELLCAAA
jgi:hypothetical protein